MRNLWIGFWAVVFVFSILGTTCSAVENQMEFTRLCSNGSPEEVAKAIDAGADVNARDEGGWTALMCAAWNNPNPDVVSVLIDAGADVNAHAQGGVTEFWTALTWTALSCAACNNPNPDVLSVLINAGADVNARDKAGWTALMLAAKFAQKVEKISLLLDAGANLWATNSMGETAYDYLKENENLNKTELFRKIENLYWQHKDTKQQ